MRAVVFMSLSGLVTAAAALLPADVALANGGDVHFGGSSTGIPVLVVDGFAVFGGLVVVFFLANWVRYRRAQRRDASTPGSKMPPGGEEEENDDIP